VPTGQSYEQLQAKVKGLENDLVIERLKQKVVVAYNKETACFEYIGEPAFLDYQRELTDLHQILDAIKAWLAKNPRLTVKAIFESLDKQNFGELDRHTFELAFNKLGLRLRDREIDVLG